MYPKIFLAVLLGTAAGAFVSIGGLTYAVPVAFLTLVAGVCITFIAAPSGEHPDKQMPPDSMNDPLTWDTSETDGRTELTDAADAKKRDDVLPSPPKTADGGVLVPTPIKKVGLSLVHTDGKRADVRDWRRRG